MIGHYVLTLSEEQEDRVLTMPMCPGSMPAGCLVATVSDTMSDWMPNRRMAHRGLIVSWGTWDMYLLVHFRYDLLCNRFGAARVNNAIRARILSNRLWRTLQNRPASEPVLLGVVR